MTTAEASRHKIQIFWRWAARRRAQVAPTRKKTAFRIWISMLLTINRAPPSQAATRRRAVHRNESISPCAINRSRAGHGIKSEAANNRAVQNTTPEVAEK